MSHPVQSTSRAPRFDRIAILADGHFEPESAKTAVGILRYGRSEVVAIVDSANAGRDCGDIMGVGKGVPMVATIDEALALEPHSLVIGIAPRGGSLPQRWKRLIKQGIRQGVDVISGLHTFLNDDPELVALAEANGCVLADVRRPPKVLPVSNGTCRTLPNAVVLTVGTDCCVGKMSVSLELVNAASQRSLKTEFVPTGQTGIMIWGRGISVDACVADFIAGAVEQMVLEVAPVADWIFVEGQGSLYHPGYSGVTMGLVHGCMPTQMVLCHQATRKSVRNYKVRIPPLNEVVAYHEQVFQPLFPTKVCAIALNTRDLSDDLARQAIRQAEQQTGLVADDCVRYGGGRLLDALIQTRAK